MVEFILECVLLCLKVCLGAVLITGIAVLVAIPFNYVLDTTRDRLENWHYRHEFDVWRLRK